jgi:hypothetical protein
MARSALLRSGMPSIKLTKTEEHSGTLQPGISEAVWQTSVLAARKSLGLFVGLADELVSQNETLASFSDQPSESQANYVGSGDAINPIELRASDNLVEPYPLVRRHEDTGFHVSQRFQGRFADSPTSPPGR